MRLSLKNYFCIVKWHVGDNAKVYGKPLLFIKYNLIIIK